MKLNLGAGDVPLDGYTPIDRKNGKEAYPLDVPDESCDEIRASHVLEHFPRAQAPEVVTHWAQKVKPGGVLKIAVPDFKRIVRNYLDGKDEPTAGYVMGGQVDDNDYHKSVFDEELLRDMMESAGLSNIEPWESEVCDCAALPISLNLKGIKGTGSVQTDTIKFDFSKLHAVMSVPRIEFTDNNMCAIKALVPLGCQISKGTGVFWDQVLTRQIEKAIAEGAEYILTIDYDTWFTRAHVLALARIMALRPDVAAVYPMQLKREDDGVLAGFRDGDGGVAREAKIPVDADIVPSYSGHFGLTMLRASAMAKLKKPWFLPEPGPDGRWEEGRTDSDMMFWRRMEEAGLGVYLAPRIIVGHLQLMCSFPPELGATDQSGRHYYIKDVEAGNIPACYTPGIELCK